MAGHEWGIQINPVHGSINDDGRFYFSRGREVIVQYNQLEDNYGEY